MAPFGVTRRLPVAVTQAKHLPTAAYYRQVGAMEQAVAKQLQGIQARNVLGLQKAKAACVHLGRVK